MTMIYLIDETEGDEAHAETNNRKMADALLALDTCKFRECTRQEYKRMVRLCEDRDSEAQS